MSEATIAADRQTCLEIREISRNFGKVRALERVSLSVATGEIVALVGESGCGKSTLLRIVAGLERADTGKILLDGYDVGALEPDRRGVGLMFQDYALFPHLTIGENVRFGLSGRQDARAIAYRRLDQVGLAARERDYPGSLSGGESQRVALARALAPEPRILLLDEPFSNLDRRTGERVRAQTMALLRAARVTTILVTHDPEEALIFADRIALMEGGRLLQAGTGDELYRHPASAFAVRLFGPCFECCGRAEHGRVETPFGVVAGDAAAHGTLVDICLRPEAFRLGPAGEGTQARVVRRSFLGEKAVLLLAVDGVDGLLTLPVAQSDPISEGDRVGLSLTGKGAFAFARDPA